jgi:hypothetical protein
MVSGDITLVDLQLYLRINIDYGANKEGIKKCRGRGLNSNLLVNSTLLSCEFSSHHFELDDDGEYEFIY